MAVSLTRAFGAFIEGKTGLKPFAGNDENRKFTYPCCVVELVSQSKKARGAGKVSYYRPPTDEEADAGVKKVAVKILDGRATLRLTVVAEQKDDGSSEKLCVKHRDEIYSALTQSIWAKTAGTIRDPDATDEEPGIFRMRLGDMLGVRSDTTGQPFLHSASIEVLLRMREKIERNITQITTDVDVNYEEAFA